MTRLIAASSASRSRSFAVPLALRLDRAQLRLELAPPVFQPVGDLGQQVVSVLEPRPDVAGAVLKFALALEIERVEEDLGHVLGVLLRGEPFGQLPGDSLIRQQFLQINSNKQPSFGGEAEGRSRNRDARAGVFSRSWFSFGPSLGACRAEELGQRLERFWTGFGGTSKELGQFPARTSKDSGPVPGEPGMLFPFLPVARPGVGRPGA